MGKMARMTDAKKESRPARRAVSDLMSALDRMIAAARDAERARERIVRKDRKGAAR